MLDQLPIGVLCAIPEEIEHFGAHFREVEVRAVAGYSFRAGTLDGVPVVLAECGIGKVNAALVATILCREFEARLLLFSGVAGGLDPALGVGDLVVGTRLVQHDYGALIEDTIKAYQPGVPPLPGFEGAIGYEPEPGLLDSARRALAGLDLPPLSAEASGGTPRQPRLHFGTIVTGDTFVNSESARKRLHAEFAGVAVEMEGAAVAQIADRFGVKCLVVRALSDLAGAESHVDFRAFLHEAAGLAATVVRRLAPVL